MPFPFVYVCDLLDVLEILVLRDPPLRRTDLDKAIAKETDQWLRMHCNSLNANATDDNAVILTFKPELRTDRVYDLDAVSLEQVIARVLNLPRVHLAELQRWRASPMSGDLGTCIQRVIDSMISMKQYTVIRSKADKRTVEEIDQSLLRISSHNQGLSSAPSTAGNPVCDTVGELSKLYHNITSREAKWLTRLILKEFGPVKFPESFECGANHSGLPRIVNVQAKFASWMPAHLRREGPGLLRLATGPEFLPSPPITAPELAVPVTKNCPSRARAGRIPNSPISTRRRSPAKSPKSNIASIKPASLRSLMSLGGKCRLTKTTCPLSNCVFILAPCIANIPYLTENLLSWHGCRFTTSPRALTQPIFSKRCSRTGKNLRKIALVESNRAKPTAEFLRGIGQLNLKRSRGKKEWVEVYDWRILECIWKIHLGKEARYNPWERCWIGAV